MRFLINSCSFTLLAIIYAFNKPSLCLLFSSIPHFSLDVKRWKLKVIVPAVGGNWTILGARPTLEKPPCDWNCACPWSSRMKLAPQRVCLPGMRRMAIAPASGGGQASARYGLSASNGPALPVPTQPHVKDIPGSGWWPPDIHPLRASIAVTPWPLLDSGTLTRLLPVPGAAALL